MTKKKKYVQPNILVLEGLWNDTADLVDIAGGYAVETTPWNRAKVRAELESGMYHGILLTGGSDVNPQLYGETPHPTVYGIDNVRDSVELMALEYARDNGLAVLGICRGSQIMCVSRGGKLVQDIQSYLEPIHTHRSDDHPVFAVPGARQFRYACGGTTGKFTSLHHQCVRRPGRGMKIAARAADGTVEAIESKDGLMLGVQFHPELSATSDEESFGFFRWLVERAARVAGGRAEPVDFRSAVTAYLDDVWSARDQARLDAQQSGEDSYGLSCGYSDNKAVHHTDTPRSGWDAREDLDGWDTEDWDAYHAGTKELKDPPARKSRKSRKAGDPAIPSMRDISAIIEESTGQKPYLIGTAEEIIDERDELAQARRAAEIGAQMQVQKQLTESSALTCPECALRFDLVEDRDDHCKYVHPTPPFANAPARFPELEPPPGHEAWNDHEDEYERLMRENGFDPRDWEDYG
jgi:putative glutamine amidotransferase